MQHGTIQNPFEVTLPLTGTRGVECRSSASLGAGNYQMVFEFDNELTSVTGASVSSSGGTCTPQNGCMVSSSMIGLNKNEYIVNLTGIPNQQYITVTLTGVAGAPNGGTVVGPQMGVLIGDVTGNGVVDNTDVSVVKGQVNPLNPVTQANFPEDVTASGFVDNTDVSVVKGQVNPLGGLQPPP
jgi:hypothetical protein